ncbi:Vacuolar-processing enzyme [Morella rubra]|uniref:Vacuolar-processing enzyme n=1 Tax=Morella rubra TaxID=262757 RepID=A0A6A1VRE1_9ROSI|nr:Vacuolar-processing enzyme [Morella rubra]
MSSVLWTCGSRPWLSKCPFMTISFVCGTFIFLRASCLFAESSLSPVSTHASELPANALGDHSSSIGGNDTAQGGKRWAVLVTDSNEYVNYRYQVRNPRPRVIINKPNGDDVYDGVPKEVRLMQITFYAVILGNKSALTRGSGKVVDSGSNDSIFIYYSDHDSLGILRMPSSDFVYAKDLIGVSKKKHEAKAYKSMVFYPEAFESRSIFEGLLPNNLNIYATTASNAKENSGYVRRRTAAAVLEYSSHVMEYGTRSRRNDSLFSYMGTNPANDNYTSAEDPSPPSTLRVVSQRDADLLHFFNKLRTYEKYCGPLSKYGRKYMRAFANMCNAGITLEQMWWDRFGADEKLFPPGLKKAYEQWPLDYSAKLQIAKHLQFLSKKSQIQPKLAAVQSHDDYKKELLEVLSQLSEEDTVEDTATFSAFPDISSQYEDNAQNPYAGYELELSIEEIEALQRSFDS